MMITRRPEELTLDSGTWHAVLYKPANVVVALVQGSRDETSDYLKKVRLASSGRASLQSEYEIVPVAVVP